MGENKTNLERLQTIADGLDELNERVVYVGGSVAQFYISDNAAADVRPTEDVDCVVEMFSVLEYEQFCKYLREQKHFHNDVSPEAPTCRYIFRDECVDIMPDDEKLLGFTNKWYKPGFKNRIGYKLSNNRLIYIMPITYFIATKLEAVLGRGGEDLRISHDFEDIIIVLNGCPDFMDRFQNETNLQLREYLKEHFTQLMSRPNIREEIECALPIGDENRYDIIWNIFTQITSN